MRLGICGPGRCGKSTAAKWLAANTPLRYVGGTSACFREVVFTAMLADGYCYDSPTSCYEDRHNHRQFWADAIGRHVRQNPVAAYSACLAFQDILEGIRHRRELSACREAGMCDAWIWIERPGCDDPTCEIRASDCDISIDNDGTLEEFHKRIYCFYEGFIERVSA